MLVHAPRPPAKNPVVFLERVIDVTHDDRDLADREGAAGRTMREGHLLLVRVRVHRASLTAGVLAWPE